jgi:hypothetical protein
VLYLLELMANGTIRWGLVPRIKELNVRPATVSETGNGFAAFPMNTKWGHQNGPTRPGTLGQTNANAYTATQ